MHLKLSRYPWVLSVFGSVAFAFQCNAAELGPWQWITPLPQGHSLFGVAYGNNRFVAVGGFGTILIRDDQWFRQQPVTTNGLWGVAYGAERFVAVGENGTIAVSDGGDVWRLAKSTITSHLNAVSFGLNHFVAVGNDAAIILSNDGENWEVVSSGFAATHAHLRSLLGETETCSLLPTKRHSSHPL